MPPLQQSASRLPLLDVAKGLLIFLVIYGHSLCNIGSLNIFLEGAYFSDFVFQSIYGFHMPLFVIISGWLFRSMIERYSWRDILIKRFWQLILPYVAWCLINYALGVITNTQALGVRALIAACIHPYWFVSTLFILSLLVLFVSKVFHDNLWGYLLIGIASFFLPNTLPIIGFDLSKSYFLYPFFVGAYLCSKFRAQTIPIALRHRSAIALVALGSYFALLLLCQPDIFVYISKFSLWDTSRTMWEQLKIDTYRFVLGVSGSLGFICLLARRSLSSPLGKPIIWLGRNSLSIYFTQELVFTYICRRWDWPFAEYAYGWHILFSIIITLACALITDVLKRNQISKKILLGMR